MAERTSQCDKRRNNNDTIENTQLCKMAQTAPHSVNAQSQPEHGIRKTRAQFGCWISLTIIGKHSSTPTYLISKVIIYAAARSSKYQKWTPGKTNLNRRIAEPPPLFAVSALPACANNPDAFNQESLRRIK